MPSVTAGRSGHGKGPGHETPGGALLGAGPGSPGATAYTSLSLSPGGRGGELWLPCLALLTPCWRPRLGGQNRGGELAVPHRGSGCDGSSCRSLPPPPHPRTQQVGLTCL